MNNRKLSFVFAISACFVFVFMAVSLRFGVLSTMDEGVGQAIRSWRTESLTSLVKGITQLGSTNVVVVVFVLVSIGMWMRKRFTEIGILFLSVVGCLLLNTVLKNAITRSRPAVEHLVEASGFSFPSGHAMFAICLYGMIAYFIVNYRQTWRTIAVTLMSFFILLVGFSRIYLGVHYPSDIIAGYAAGSLWFICCIAMYKRMRYRFVSNNLTQGG